jgi:isopenicillin N synthase-like dioxygenase
LFDFRWTLDRYSAAVKSVADRLLGIMLKNLGLEPGVIAEKCVGGIQAARMNYYPPCAEAHKVVGFAPHSDSDLPLVLQVNEVQGLQIRGKGDGRWVPVKPVEGVLVVNVGDIFEVWKLPYTPSRVLNCCY